MKSITVAVLAFFAGMQSLTFYQNSTGTLNGTDQMVPPKIEHHTYETTQKHDTVTRSCPAGYEGHFVDKQEGFDSSFPQMIGSWGIEGYPSGAPAYTICFKNDFMEQIRKNPDLTTYRPAPPRAVINITPDQNNCIGWGFKSVPCPGQWTLVN